MDAVCRNLIKLLSCRLPSPEPRSASDFRVAVQRDIQKPLEKSQKETGNIETRLQGAANAQH